MRLISKTSTCRWHIHTNIGRADRSMHQHHVFFSAACELQNIAMCFRLDVCIILQTHTRWQLNDTRAQDDYECGCKSMPLYSVGNKSFKWVTSMCNWFYDMHFDLSFRNPRQVCICTHYCVQMHRPMHGPLLMISSFDIYNKFIGGDEAIPLLGSYIMHFVIFVMWNSINSL